MIDSPLDSKNINKQISSSNYISDINKESEKLNEPKSNTFQSGEIHNESNNDSLIKNIITDEKIDTEHKSLFENEEDRFLILKAKYKQLEEKIKILNKELKKDELIIEEQNNVILLLKSSIENDFFKNNDINKYLTTENIIDFIKLKNENEQYKKELVLSQALVNSLQNENLRLIKEREENSNIINIETEDLVSGTEKRIYDINSYTRDNDVIDELNKENNVLKKLIQEATVKLNYLLVNEKNHKILSDENNILNFQLKEKNNIINKYEEKLSFFNSYINDIKFSFNKLRQYIINSINSYNKIANDDLNSLLSNSFSQNIMKLSMQISNLDEIDQYNLESNPELEIHNILSELIFSINDEFIILYEKVFQTNKFYKESTDKINILESQIKECNTNNISNTNSEIEQLKDEYVKTIIKLNLELSSKESDNYYLNENNICIKQNFEEALSMLSLIIKAVNNNNKTNLVKSLKNFVQNLKGKKCLISEKEEKIRTILKNNHKIKILKLENKNEGDLQFYEDEKINKIINDFQKKLEEIDKKIANNKKQINSFLC